MEIGRKIDGVETWISLFTGLVEDAEKKNEYLKTVIYYRAAHFYTVRSETDENGKSLKHTLYDKCRVMYDAYYSRFPEIVYTHIPMDSKSRFFDSLTSHPKNILWRSMDKKLSRNYFTNHLLKQGSHIYRASFRHGADAAACVKSTCLNIRKAGCTIHVILLPLSPVIFLLTNTCFSLIIIVRK